MVETKRKENRAMDVCKAVCCLIIVTAHLPPLFADQRVDAFYGEWYLRFCVPFFFLCSGYFFQLSRNRVKSLKRIAWVLLLGYVLYLPAILQGAWDASAVISKLRWNLVFGYEHLWYLSAAMEGMLAWYLWEKLPVLSRLFPKAALPLALALLMAGAALDEYYKIAGEGLLWQLGSFLSVFGGPRNAIFMGFPLLVIGGWIARKEEALRKIPLWVLVLSWCVLRAAGYLECRFLFDRLGYDISGDITFFGWTPAVVLLLLTFRVEVPIPDALAKLLRKLSEYVYILHPMAAMWITRFLPITGVWLWAATVALCVAIYLLLEKQLGGKK